MPACGELVGRQLDGQQLLLHQPVQVAPVPAVVAAAVMAVDAAAAAAAAFAAVVAPAQMGVGGVADTQYVGPLVGSQGQAAHSGC